MEVVSLIFGPMLVSRTCLHAFWVLTSIHLSFLLKMCFIILVFIVFFLNGVNMFVDTGISYISYEIIQS